MAEARAAVRAVSRDDHISDRDILPSDLGKLSVLAGVREFPTRVKCASLAWHTMKAAVASDRDAPVSTE